MPRDGNLAAMGIIHTLFGSLEPKDRAELARSVLPRHRLKTTTVEFRPTVANILGPERRVTTRGLDELIALCRVVLADDKVDESEAQFLLDWMEKNFHTRDTWPGIVLFERLSRAIVDRHLDPREELELLDVLRKVATAANAVTRLNPGGAIPFDDPPPTILYPTRRFALTGQFVYGSRKRVEAAIAARGGVCSPSLDRHVAYLIVGAFESAEWRQGNFGTKIGEAVDLKLEGQPVAIVSERHWHEQLG
jgi:hypothetical protein